MSPNSRVTQNLPVDVSAMPDSNRCLKPTRSLVHCAHCSPAKRSISRLTRRFPFLGFFALLPGRPTFQPQAGQNEAPSGRARPQFGQSAAWAGSPAALEPALPFFLPIRTAHLSFLYLDLLAVPGKGVASIAEIE